MSFDLANQFGVLESLAAQLRSTPGVTAVAIRSGRRSTEYGQPVGPPRASWTLGSGLRVDVWGEDSPFIDSLLELARLIDHREQEIDELTEALTQAHDRQLRLFELSRLNVDSLDREYTVDRVLNHGIELTDATDAVLVGSGTAPRWLSNESELAPTWLIDVVTHAIGNGSYRKPLCPPGKSALLARVALGGADVVLALGRSSGELFGTAERKIIDALAGSLGSALRLVELHESALVQAIVENEHATAAALAGAVLPKELPKVAGLDAFARSIPARAVGGDYYTAVAVGDVFRFAIGDVAGKGLPAAVLMTNAITSTNSVFRNGRGTSAVELLGEIHDALDTFLVGANRFITMVVGIATPVAERPGEVELRLANAGHSPVIVTVGGQLTSVPPCAPPIGVGMRPEGTDFVVRMLKGDWFVTGSDGLLEQDNDAEEMFGMQRLEALVSGKASAETLATTILNEVALFGGDRPHADDQTVFTLRPSWEDSMTVDEAGICRLMMEADLLAVRELAVWLPESVEAVAGSEAEHLVGQIELSIHELCINIVEHAYDGQPGRVRIELRRVDDELAFEISDEGKAFDPALIDEPDPATPTIRGYGLMIIRQLASSVRYERKADRNVWELRFAINGVSR